jgi:hypothetical protein
VATFKIEKSGYNDGMSPTREVNYMSESNHERDIFRMPTPREQQEKEMEEQRKREEEQRAKEEEK